MIEFDVLKRSWQNQTPAKTEKFDIEEIAQKSLSKLKKFERKQFRINLIKTSGVILLFAFLAWTMLFASAFSVIKLIAIIWLFASSILFLNKFWKVQFKVNNLTVKDNSLDFIDEVLDNFSEQRKLFKEKFWWFGVALTIGINILYLDLLKDLQLLDRIGFHLLGTALMIAVIWGGIKVRMFRFKKENEPIENELIKIKNDLKEIK